MEIYDIEIVACDVIYKCDFTVSNLKLNKILYFVYAANLYEHEKSITNENPEAWMYGPVFPSVYHEYKQWGADLIQSIYAYENITSPKYTETTKKVVKKLKNFTESALISLTHREGGAWDRVYNPKIPHNVIPDELIKREFESFYVRK